MLGWLRRRRRRPGVFYYHDGQQDRSIDPVLACIALDTHPEYVEERDAKGIDQGNAECTLTAAKAVRDVFGVKPLDEGGLTTDEQITILYRFYAYIAAQKKSGAPSQTPPSPTGPTSPDSSERIRRPSQGSTSTLGAQSCDTPTESDPPLTPASACASEASDTQKTGSPPPPSTKNEAATSTTSTK